MSKSNTKTHSTARRAGNTGKSASRKKAQPRGHKFLRTLFALLCVIGVGIVVSLYNSENSSAFTAKDTGPVAEDGGGDPEVQQEGLSRPATTGKKGSGIRGKLVVIDAGHGGFDCGATGASGSHEDDLNLAVAQCLREELIRSGAQVIMTRKDEEAIAPTKDEDMEKRRQIIADSHSDIVVSIHMNSYEDPHTRGHIVYFMQGSTQGQRLAQAIGSSMDESLDKERKNNVQSNDYFILKSGNQPCVLVECGFITCPEEEAKLLDADYQEQVGEAICDGITEYFKS